MPYRRSIFLINKPFQVRFSIYVCSWLIALSFVYPIVVYNLFQYFVRYVAHDPLGPPVEALNHTRHDVLWLLILLQLVFLLISFLISLFMSHRIAGPLFKLMNAFEVARDGDLSEKLQFRTKDHFQEIAESYNEMVTGLRESLEKNIDSVSTVIANLEEIQKGLPEGVRPQFDKNLANLREIREKLPH